ncbi:hypothetical protein EAO70_02380 [Streptomyces sp. adm13(2018)]|nr:hypothetical protein EAO70_02380 [Streptomyces sp. adm13(2018)]
MGVVPGPEGFEHVDRLGPGRERVGHVEEPQQLVRVRPFRRVRGEEAAVPEGGEPPVVAEVRRGPVAPVRTTGEQVVGERGDGPQVVARVDGAASRALLGRGPGGRPVRRALLPRAQRRVRLAEPGPGPVPADVLGGDRPVDDAEPRHEADGHGELAGDALLVVGVETARPLGERAPDRRAVEHEGFGGGQVEADDPGEDADELLRAVTPFEGDRGRHLSLQESVRLRAALRLGGGEPVLHDGHAAGPQDRPAGEEPGAAGGPAVLPEPHDEAALRLPGGEELQFPVVRMGRRGGSSPNRTTKRLCASLGVRNSSSR